MDIVLLNKTLFSGIKGIHKDVNVWLNQRWGSPSTTLMKESTRN